MNYFIPPAIRNELPKYVYSEPPAYFNIASLTENLYPSDYNPSTTTGKVATSYLGQLILRDTPDLVNSGKVNVAELISKSDNSGQMIRNLYSNIARVPRNVLLGRVEGVDLSKALGNRIGWFRPHYLLGMRALLLGPVGFDVYVVGCMIKKQRESMTFNPSIVSETLLDRPHDELETFLDAYRTFWGSDLLEDITKKQDIYGATRKLWRDTIEKSASRATKKGVGQLQKAAEQLHEAVLKRTREALAIFLSYMVTEYNTYELRAIWAIYANTYEGKSLSRLVSSTLVIKDELHAFRHILSPANPKYTPENAKWGSLVPSSLEGQVEYARVRRDARALHETLKGHTAEDDELVVRVARFFRAKERWGSIQAVFLLKYRKTLDEYVTLQASGDHKNLMRVLITEGQYLESLKK